MENLVQREIIQVVVKARNQGEDIKQLIKVLAREFTLTESMVKGIIEFSATYGLERVNESGSKTEGKTWKPLDYMKAIERLEDIIYELRAEVVKLHNRMNRELGMRENPWTERKLSSLETEEEPLEAQENEELRARRYDDGERIRKIAEIIDRAKAKGKIGRTHEDIEPEKMERIGELRDKIDKARNRLDRREEKESPTLTFRGLERLKTETGR